MKKPKTTSTLEEERKTLLSFLSSSISFFFLVFFLPFSLVFFLFLFLSLNCCVFSKQGKKIVSAADGRRHKKVSSSSESLSSFFSFLVVERETEREKCFPHFPMFRFVWGGSEGERKGKKERKKERKSKKERKKSHFYQNSRQNFHIFFL